MSSAHLSSAQMSRRKCLRRKCRGANVFGANVGEPADDSSWEPFLRNYYMPLAAAAYSDSPNDCLANIQKWDDAVENNPNETISVYRQYKIKCPSLNDICSGYTAVLNTNEENSWGPLIIAFKGTVNFEYFYANVWDHNNMVPFVGAGKVSKQFLDAFNAIWINAGMRDDVLTLKNKYPFSGFLVVGHSTGGAMAALAAVTMSVNGISGDIGLFTFGQPRTGDLLFANDMFSQNFGDSDRVVHNADIVPHLPSSNESSYYHHISEWWWPNDMVDGSDYVQCSLKDGEDPTCSNSLEDSTLNFDDHKLYFGRKFDDYGISGCPDLASSKNVGTYNLKPIPNSSLFISPLAIVYTKNAKNKT